YSLPPANDPKPIRHSSFGLHAAFFRRPATIVWQRCDVFDRLDRQARGLQGGDCRFATRSRSLNFDFDFTEAKFGRLVGCHFRGALSREWSALAAPLEPDSSRRCETERIAVRVRDGYDRVVEGGLDMGHAAAYIPPGLFLLAFRHD